MTVQSNQQPSAPKTTVAIAINLKAIDFKAKGLTMARVMVIIGMTIAMTCASTAVLAQAPVSDPAKLESRIRQLERSVSRTSMVQLHQSVKSLAREVRQLRGQIEEQSHALSQLKRSQADLSKDLDRRMRALESSGGVAGNTLGSALNNSQGNVQGTSPQATATQSNGTLSGATAPQTPSDNNTSQQPQLARVDPAEEQKAYRAAFDLLKGGKFTAASTALASFLGKYPNGNFADNAQYWLGEAHYVSREFGPSLKAFEQLLVDYPDSPKRPHSMLKIGFIHDETGNKDEARKVLTELTKLYPQSTAASLAAKRLKRLP